MKERIIVPVVDERGLDAQLSEHFGRSPFFVVVELEDRREISSVRTVPNFGEHFGGRGHVHDSILQEKPDAIIVYGIGPRGLSSFQEGGVAVLKANANTVKEVIAAYKENKLQELTNGCHQAHHC